MVENIEKTLDRGDWIELFVDKTATMQAYAFHFRKQSKHLRRSLGLKSAKLLWTNFLPYAKFSSIFEKYTFYTFGIFNNEGLNARAFCLFFFLLSLFLALTVCFWSLTGHYWHAWLSVLNNCCFLWRHQFTVLQILTDTLAGLYMCWALQLSRWLMSI